VVTITVTARSSSDISSFARAATRALLLRLHAQLLEKAGMGCIVRAIVDRQTA
jgi:hypothetical protein